MIKIFKSAPLLIFATLCAFAHGQDIPAVTSASDYHGFALPDVPGNLTFSISGTESARSGFYGSGNEVYITTISGDAGFLSNSTIHPFRLTYAGGYSYTSSGQQSAPFQNLTLSQTFGSRNWTFDLNDSFRYLPESPSSGLSGLTGLGDLGIPIPNPGGQDLLTAYGQRVINTASADVDRKITGSTDITGTGTYALQRFVDSTTLGDDYNQYSGQGGIKHRINALSSITATYDFTRFSYINVNFSFVSQGGTLQYVRQWTRRFSTTLAGGPQLHSSSNVTLGGSSLTYSANLDATYLLQRGSIDASYIRGIQGGSGLTQGSTADTLRGDVSHRIGEYSNITFDATYAKHHQLFAANAFSADTVTGSVQLSRTITPNFSVYGSYTAQNQLTTGTITNSAPFNGLSQTVSVGLSYSPRPIHLGH